MRYIKKLLLAVMALFLFRPTPARADVSPISILNFQVAGIYAMAGTNSLFVQGSWTPSINLGILGVRGEVGITGLDFGTGRFAVSNWEALLQLMLAPTATLEAGGGLHIWHGVNPAALALTGNLVFSGMPGIDRVFVGYTRYTGGTGANEIRAGIGFGI